MQLLHLLSTNAYIYVCMKQCSVSDIDVTIKLVSFHCLGNSSLAIVQPN